MGSVSLTRCSRSCTTTTRLDFFKFRRCLEPRPNNLPSGCLGAESGGQITRITLSCSQEGFIQMNRALLTTQTRRHALTAAGATATTVSAAALAACGASQGAPSTQSASTGSALFWQWGAGYVDGFQALVNEFNEKKTGVTIDFDPSAVTSGSTDYWVKLTAA